MVVVVAAAAAALSLVLTSGGHATTSGLRSLTGRVMAVSSTGSIISVDPASGRISRYPVFGGGGPLAPVAISSDGQAILDAAGTIFDVNGPRIASGSDTVSEFLSHSTVPAPSTPFADQNHAVLVLTRPTAMSPAAASLVRLNDGHDFDLGTVDSAGGDALSLGAFVSIPLHLHQPVVAHPASPDTEVELVVASKPPVLLATSSQLNAYAGSLPSTPIQLSVYPSPSGEAVAVVLNPLTPVTGDVPMVVLDRQGQLLAAFTDRDGPMSGTDPVWSPGGRQLAYPSYTITGAALAVATETGSVQDLPAPTASTSFGQCVWSPDSTAVVCGSRAANRYHWLYATATRAALIPVSSPGAPLAWTTAGHS